MRSGRWRYAVGVVVIVAAFGFLVAGSMKSNTLRAMPVDQLRKADAGPQSQVGQRLKISGFVGQEPVKRVSEKTPQGTIEVKHFNVVLRGKSVAVTLKDALPEMFKKGLPVQVEGTYIARGKFRADAVFTKCPSKYQAEKSQTGANDRSAMAATHSGTKQALD